MPFSSNPMSLGLKRISGNVNLSLSRVSFSLQESKKKWFYIERSVQKDLKNVKNQENSVMKVFLFEKINLK